MAGQTVIVSVLADTKRFSKAWSGLSKELGLGGLTKGLSNVAGAVADAVKGVVVGVGAIGATLAGMALHGGIKRALNIEDAQAALKGLGYDATQVQGAMDSALAAVKGTVYGLDEAATAASQALAAGVSAGDDLTRYISLIGDAAQIGRVSMGDMSSIFAKVITSNRLYTQEINQLADKGLPIWTWLADEMGVTQEALREMVSAGQVDAETFLRVIETNIGGAALAAGDTTRGAFRNMQAALSRLGATFVNQFLPLVKDGFAAFTGVLDDLGQYVGPIAERLAGWVTGTLLPALASFKDFLVGDVWPVVRQVWDRISSAVATALATVREAFAPTGESTLTLSSAFEAITPVVLGLTDVLAGAIKALGEVAAWVKKNTSWLGPLAAGIAGAALAFGAYSKAMRIAQAAQVAVTAATKLFNTTMARSPIGLVITLVGTLAAGFGTLMATNEGFRRSVMDVFSNVLAAIQPVIDIITNDLLPVFSSIVGNVMDSLGPALATLTEVLTGTLAPAIGNLFESLGPIIEVLGEVAATILTILGPPIEWVSGIIVDLAEIFTGVLGGAIGIISGIINGLSGLLTNAGGWFRNLGNAVRDAINTAVDWVKGLPGRILDALSSAGTWLVERGRQFMTGLWNGLKEAWQTVVQFFLDLPSNIGKFFSNAGQWLIEAGKAILNGLWNGLKSIWDGIKNFFGGIGNWIKEHKGPLDYDRALLVPAGKAIMQGLSAGLKSQMPALRSDLAGITNTIAGADLGTLTMPTLAFGSGGYGSNTVGTGASITVNVNALAPSPEIGRVVVAAIRDYERVNGVGR